MCVILMSEHGRGFLFNLHVSATMSNTTAYWFSLSILICVAIAQQRPTADLGYVKYIGISNATLGYEQTSPTRVVMF